MFFGDKESSPLNVLKEKDNDMRLFGEEIGEVVLNAVEVGLRVRGGDVVGQEKHSFWSAYLFLVLDEKRIALGLFGKQRIATVHLGQSLVDTLWNNTGLQATILDKALVFSEVAEVLHVFVAALFLENGAEESEQSLNTLPEIDLGEEFQGKQVELHFFL